MGTSDHQKVLEAIEDRYYEKEQLSDKKDIIAWTGLTNTRVTNAIADLEGNGLFKLYDKNGVTTLYVTKQMKNSLTAEVSEPDWLKNYEFDEKTRLQEEISEANDQIADYQSFERLLYGGGIPLEESVEHTLDWLGFDVNSTANEEDFLIEEDSHVYVIEVKGLGGRIKKQHVTQLSGWLDKKISEGIKHDELTGLLIHNHERHDSPSERGNPLTSTAEEFLKHQRSRHISTEAIFNLVEKVMSDDIDKADARAKVLGGEAYD